MFNYIHQSLYQLVYQHYSSQQTTPAFPSLAFLRRKIHKTMYAAIAMHALMCARAHVFAFGRVNSTRTQLIHPRGRWCACSNYSQRTNTAKKHDCKHILLKRIPCCNILRSECDSGCGSTPNTSKTDIKPHRACTRAPRRASAHSNWSYWHTEGSRARSHHKHEPDTRAPSPSPAPTWLFVRRGKRILFEFNSNARFERCPGKPHTHIHTHPGAYSKGWGGGGLYVTENKI